MDTLPTIMDAKDNYINGKQNQFKLWLDWHLGLINRELTEEEINDIDASDMAMHLLVTTESINRFLDKYKGSILREEVLKELVIFYRVPVEVIIFKIQYVIEQNKKEQEKVKKLTKK